MEIAKPGKRILIGFGESLAAIETCWSLQNSGYFVTAFMRRGKSSAISKCKNVSILSITPPEENFYTSVTELKAFASSGSFDLVLPLDDIALSVCQNTINGKRKPLYINCNPYQVRLSLDKREQIFAATKSNFNVPKTRTINTIQDLLSLYDYPLIIKPTNAFDISESKAIKGPFAVCSTRSDLKNFAKMWNERCALLSQPWIAGVGEGVFGIASYGKTFRLSAHKRVRMMNPAGSGSSACVAIEPTKDIIEQTNTLISSTNWHGMFMIELLRDSSNKLWFMEINGRPWGSMALARRMGCEYPAWAANQMLTPDWRPPQDTRQFKPILCRNLGREIIHLISVAKGPKFDVLKAYWPNLLTTIINLLKFKKEDAWYNLESGNYPVFLYDCYYSLKDKLSSGK